MTITLIPLAMFTSMWSRNSVNASVALDDINDESTDCTRILVDSPLHLSMSFIRHPSPITLQPLPVAVQSRRTILQELPVNNVAQQVPAIRPTRLNSSL